MKSAIVQLTSKKSLKSLEHSDLRNKIEQLLKMAREIKAAKKSNIESSEHFCKYEYARSLERIRTIIHVCWPIYKKDLINLS